MHTSSLPATIPVLKKELPSIFHSLCFNDSNFTFKQEVRDTEIAHLFEHIVLEYLCHIKSVEGGDNVQFQGETKWNWAVDPRGTFHISIDSGLSLSHVFKKALEKAIELINKIIEESEARRSVVTLTLPTTG